MRVLILEDNELRALVINKKFKRNFAGCEVVHVTNYTDVINALEKQPVFDYATLDCDLGLAHGNWYDGRARSGIDVAKYITKMPRDRVPKKIFVHSGSLQGASAMVLMLNDGGIEAWCLDPLFMEHTDLATF